MRAKVLGFGATLVVSAVALVACEVHMNDGKPASPTTGTPTAAPAPAPAPAPVPGTPGATPQVPTSNRRFYNPNRVDPTPAPTVDPTIVDAGPAPTATDAGSATTDTDAGGAVATGDAGTGLSTAAKLKKK